MFREQEEDGEGDVDFLFGPIEDVDESSSTRLGEDGGVITFS